jgi:hypothetical protein
MPSETRRKPIHGGSDTASLRCRVSEGTALTPFTLRKTKHSGRGEHAVKSSMAAPTLLPCGVGFQRAQHSLPLLCVKRNIMGEGSTP